jgi:hypothetical protein
VRDADDRGDGRQAGEGAGDEAPADSHRRGGFEDDGNYRYAIRT